MDYTVAERLIPRDRYLHSVLWNETGDTSNVKGSLDIEGHPVNTKYHRGKLLLEGMAALKYVLVTVTEQTTASTDLLFVYSVLL